MVPGATVYYVFSDPANVLLQTLDASTTSWTETGLSVNTIYQRKIRAADAFTQSGDSTIAARSTLAVPPLSLTIAGVTSASISLAWDPSVNPAGTLFGIERSPDGTTFTPVAAATGVNATDTGLLPATTYYYRLQAINNDSIGTTYTVVVLTRTTASSTPPMAPNGVSGSLNGSQFQLTWRPVTTDVNGIPISIDHYLVERYTNLDSTAPVSTVAVPPNVTGYLETVTTHIYYRVRTVMSDGRTSEPSDFIDSTLTRYVLAAEDPTTRVQMPQQAARELLAEHNALGKDLQVRLVRRRSDETDTTLRSYVIAAYEEQSGQEVTGFSFTQKVTVQLGYGALTGSGRFRAGSSGSIGQTLSIYWFNGTQYIPVGNSVLASGSALSADVRNLGIYQLRAVQLGSHFALVQGSPYPRIITPNDPSQNNRVFFFLTTPSKKRSTARFTTFAARMCVISQVDDYRHVNAFVGRPGFARGGESLAAFTYKVQAGEDGCNPGGGPDDPRDRQHRERSSIRGKGLLLITLLFPLFTLHALRRPPSRITARARGRPRWAGRMWRWGTMCDRSWSIQRGSVPCSARKN